MDTLDYLTGYYSSYDEDGRLLRRHGQVEFLTTMRYIDKYLFPGARILEIGAGTGRYSHTLARRGYSVDAVELVEHNIERFKGNTQPGEQVTITQGNAIDLSGFADGTYDLTLLLGPMYHLFTTEDKLKALSEALRVTKRGGIVFAAYCLADACILRYGFVSGEIKNLIAKGLVDPDSFRASSDPKELFELHRKEDIDALMQGFDAERLHFAAADGYTLHMKEAVDTMDEETFAFYLRYHFTLCERPDMIGLTHHALDVFRKN